MELSNTPWFDEYSNEKSRLYSWYCVWKFSIESEKLPRIIRNRLQFRILFAKLIFPGAEKSCVMHAC